MTESSDFELATIEILKRKPASAETISALTGYPTNSVLMKLRRLESWGVVKPITKKKMIIWGLPSD